MVHFADLVAEALGLPQFTHSYKAMRIAADSDAAYAALAPKAESRGVNMKRLKAATKSHFGKSRM